MECVLINVNTDIYNELSSKQRIIHNRMLATVIVSAIVILLFLLFFYLKYTTRILLVEQEGFAVRTCPKDPTTNNQTTSYITDDGITNCCKGEVIDNFCGNVLCSLSPGPNNCSAVLATQVQNRSSAKCPSSISGDCRNYFTNSTGSVKGCSKSNLNADLTGPSDLNQPYCRLYDTADANTSNYDSCQNYLVRFNAVAGLATCSINAKLAAASNDLATCKAKATLAAP